MWIYPNGGMNGVVVNREYLPYVKQICLIDVDGMFRPKETTVLFNQSDGPFGMHNIEHDKAAYDRLLFRQQFVFDERVLRIPYNMPAEQAPAGTVQIFRTNYGWVTDFHWYSNTYITGGTAEKRQFHTVMYGETSTGDGDYFYYQFLYSESSVSLGGVITCLAVKSTDTNYYKEWSGYCDMESVQDKIAYALNRFSRENWKLRNATWVVDCYREPTPPWSGPVFPSSLSFPNAKSWGELAADAYNSLPYFNSNGLAYAKDFAGLAEAAKSTVDAIKSLRHPTPQKVASIYLSFHYGWKLTAADTAELVKSVQKTIRDWRRQSKLTASTSDNYGRILQQRYLHVYYEPFGQLTDAEALVNMFDLDLTLDNVWDMIPYSFIVDWVTNIGDLATGVENFFTATQKNKILCSQTSTKTSLSQYTVEQCKSGATRVIFNVRSSYKRRYLWDYYFLPEYHLSVTINEIPSHIMELGALIVSRPK